MFFKISDVNLYDRTVLIYGKGAKERIIQIGNDDVTKILNTYKNTFLTEMQKCNHFLQIQTELHYPINLCGA